MNPQGRHEALAQPSRAPRRITASLPGKTQKFSLGQASLEVKLVLLAWLILVLDPHQWLASLGLPRPVVARAHLVPIVLLTAYLAARLMSGGLRHLAPLTTYVCYVVLAVPLAFNRGMAMHDAKLMIVVWIVAVAALTYLRRLPHLRLVLLTLLLYRYVWFAIQGVRTGTVPWHPAFGNQDGFGSIMAAGLAGSVALAMAAKERRFRNAAILTAVLCAAGLVSSFARGAVLSGAVGLGFIWFRATGRRFAYAATVALLVGVTFVAGSIFSNVSVARGGGDVSASFWQEIASIQESITNPEEEERRGVWRIGWQVFIDNPILGAGVGSWAPYAGYHYANDLELMGERFRNRNSIYTRALHNIYLQLLAEQGLVGTLLFAWVLMDFMAKCRAIRRSSPKEDCSVLSGFRTRMVVTAFEATLVASLVLGLFYNVLNFWFLALIIGQALFYRAWAEQRVLSRQEGMLAGP